MFQVIGKQQKKITINCLELQMRVKGKLNRNHDIVKTGTGVWENKKRKSEERRLNKELKEGCFDMKFK